MFVWKEIIYLKFKIILKPFFYLYLMFLFIQLDNDDAPTMKMTAEKTDKVMRNKWKLLRTFKL